MKPPKQASPTSSLNTSPSLPALVTRRDTIRMACLLGLAPGLANLVAADKEASPAPSPGFTIQLDTITSGFDGGTCWVAPRAGIVPGPSPSVVLTMQKLLLKGSDIFFAVNEVRTDDLGKTWSQLGRRPEKPWHSG
jgi:hypothetical protein